MGQGLAIDAAGLVKRFGAKVAVDGLSLRIPAGTIYGILGPNGAGKTTTLRMLLGIILPDAGQITVLGGKSHREAAQRIGYLAEERGLYRDMRVRDVFAFAGALRGLGYKEARLRGEKLLNDFDLGSVGRKRIKNLSKGMAQIVQMIGAVLHDPELLVLDEPFSGLDAFNQARLERLIRELALGGTTVVFSTHVIAHAERLCERVAIIGQGQLRFEGSVEEARDCLPSRVRLGVRGAADRWRSLLPEGAEPVPGGWQFPLGAGGMAGLLGMLGAQASDVTALAVERASLHEAFVALVGEDWAQDDMAAGDLA